MVIVGKGFQIHDAPPKRQNPGAGGEITSIILEQEPTKTSPEIFQKVLSQYKCSSSLSSSINMVRDITNRNVYVMLSTKWSGNTVLKTWTMRTPYPHDCPSVCKRSWKNTTSSQKLVLLGLSDLLKHLVHNPKLRYGGTFNIVTEYLKDEDKYELNSIVSRDECTVNTS